MSSTSLEAFYTKFGAGAGGASLADLSRQVGHFNVFNIADLAPYTGGERPMLFDKRLYYKISLCSGPSRVEYGDQVLDIAQQAVFLATPRVPYRWVPRTPTPSGYFCIFNQEFLLGPRGGGAVEELPIFQPGAYPLWEVDATQAQVVQGLFEKMSQEIISDYAYKYDLLRSYLWELIHLVQKLQSAPSAPPAGSAAERLATQFGELLERQFPLPGPGQALRLRTPTDFADQLAVHVNYLNRALKEATGHTTSALLAGRLTQEAKILLRQTTWSITQIAEGLGFTDTAHFCTFFKRQTQHTPGEFRS
jgi:AraC-like DNA-binding protein